MSKERIKVQGYVLLDVDVVALNNAGKDTMSNFDNPDFVTQKTCIL